MDSASTSACAGCSQSSTRRDFLRDTAGAAAALFCALGASPSQLAALPIETASGRRTSISEVSYLLPTADGVTIDRDNEVILVRWQSSLYAFALSCPHQRTMLKWMPRDQRFQCPKHKSRYQPNGSFISGRATRGMDRYPLRRQNAEVLVNTASPILEDTDPPAWNAATLKL